jgi:hypothetical protein
MELTTIPANLFIFSFEGNTDMRKFKIFMKVVCFGMLCLLCGKLFRYLLIDDTASYTRIMMHELYHMESNIDVLFVGSSHCYISFVPQIADEILQKNTFNAGSASQQLDGSLAVMKEAVKYHDIERIYLDVYYNIALKDPYKERSDLTDTYILSDYTKPSLHKIDYLLSASSKEYYVNSFILARRNWKKLFDPEYISEVCEKKADDGYQDYDYEYVATDNETYMGKGYVANRSVMTEGAYWISNPFPSINEDTMSDDWKNSLSEIIDFCHDQEIELILVSTPMPNFRLKCVGNYDDYITYINEFIEGTDVKYYDFNLCRETYIPHHDGAFADNNHLNCYSAEIFTEVFSKFFAGQISEEELFYDSYEEKLQHLPEDVYGIVVEENKENYFITITPVSTAPLDEITCQVIRKPDNGTPIEAPNAELLTEIPYPEGEHGTFEIITYLEGEEVNHVFVEYGMEDKVA